MRWSSRSIRLRQSRVASTGEIFRAAIACASVVTVQSVTALAGIALALEGNHEAGRLFGDGEIGRRPLDGGRETRDIRAHQTLRIAHRAAPAGS